MKLLSPFWLSGLLVISGASAFGADDIEVKIDSLTNTYRNGAIEACGTAVHVSGVKPLVVTLKHDQSYYTTLTAPNGKWCILFKRWTTTGKVEVTGATLGQLSLSDVTSAELPSN